MLQFNINLAKFVDTLFEKGITLKVYEANRLVCTMPPDYSLDANERDTLKKCKFELIQLLNTFYLEDGVESIYALSSLQKGFLFHYLYTPHSNQYCGQIGLRYESEIDRDAFKYAWFTLVKSYPVLRTSFEWTEHKQPIQIVYNKVSLNWYEEDWSNDDSTVQKEKIDRYINDLRKKSFDLTKPGLIRLHLICLSKNCYQFILEYHHIILDGWSSSIIFSEFKNRYHKLQNDGKVNFFITPNYENYIKWLYLQDKNSAERFWCEELSTANFPTPIATAKVNAYSGLDPIEDVRSQTRALDIQFSNKIIAFAKLHKRTLSTVFQLAWAIVLSHYSNQKDVVFGITVSGRSPDLVDVEKIVGPFINTVPFRVKLDNDKTINKHLLDLHEKIQEIITHSYLSLAEIKNNANLKTNSSLFYTLMVFENYPVMTSNLDSLKVLDFQSYQKTNYPLLLIIYYHEELILKATYDKNVFDDDSIHQILNTLQNVLKQIIQNLDHPLSHINPFTLSENDYKLLEKYNSTQTQFPSHSTIHELVETQANSNPNAIAVLCENESLTYAQLNWKSNQLAHYIGEKLGRVGKHIKPDTPIILCMNRGLEMVVAILAILKSGGAYVPVEPDYPVSRIKFILDDTRSSLIITQKNIFNKSSFLKDDETIMTIYLDAESNLISDSPAEKPNHISCSRQLAYIIYTSGSSGQPKGVMVEHRGIINQLYWMQNQYKLKPTERVLQLMSYCFDASVRQFFWPMLVGAGLVVLPSSWKTNPLSYIEQINIHNVTTVYMVPTLLKDFISKLEQFPADFLDNFPLRRINCGAEILYIELKERLHRLLPRVKLYNHYGPTEASANVSHWDCRDRLNLQCKSIPIGKPINNTKLYVLDESLRLLPAGITGELYISGVGLARGYLNNPVLTAEKFISNPFISDQDVEYYKKMYKTGDKVLRLKDGSIEFLGRFDDQIKWLGHRIDPNEIEAMLLTHDSINQCVISLQFYNKQSYLVAYYVLKMKKYNNQTNNSPDANQLQKYLTKLLPSYMVPNFYVELSELPTNANNKIDRKSLPPIQLNANQPRKNDEDITRIEMVLLRIWRLVLKIQNIGLEDNFFAIGGHSLLAMEIINSVNQFFKGNIPIKILFENPSIKEFAQYLTKSDAYIKNNSFFPIERADKYTYVPLSFAQLRLWFIHKYQNNSSANYNTGKVLQIYGELNIDILESALSKLLIRHEILRTLFDANADGEPVQVITKPWSVKIPTEKINGQVLNDKLNNFMNVSFDLSKAPLWRVVLFQLSANENIFVICKHHIITDALSSKLFFKELGIIYNALINGQSYELFLLTIQYSDYSIWQREVLEKGYFDSQINYWERKLQNYLTLDYPIDKPRSINQQLKGISYSKKLDLANVAKMNNLKKEYECTPFMFFLSIFSILLYRYTGQTDLIVGTPIANRINHQLQNILGFFDNTLALRINLIENQNFFDLLQNIKNICLEAYENQEAPFEILVDKLKIERSTNQTPLFQIMFLVTNIEDIEKLRWGSTEIKYLPFKPLSCKFDLTFHISLDQTPAIYVEYNSGLFFHKSIKTMVDCFNVIFSSVIENPDQSIRNIEILSKSEIKKVLDLKKIRDQKITVCSIQRLFENQVEKTPMSIALQFQNKEMTYYELNVRANKLAQYLSGILLNEKIEPRAQSILLFLDRSFEAIITILGVLKSGACYVPMELTYPEERMKLILTDLMPAVIITSSNISYKFKFLKEFCKNIIFIDNALFKDDCTGIDNLNKGGCYTDPAYIIYTSGSTGAPKGVVIPHVSVINRILSFQKTFKILQNEKVLQKTPYSFDVSVAEILWPLCYGARLIIADPEKHRDLEYLINLIAIQNIENIHFTPSVLRLLYETVASDNNKLKNLLTLKRIFCSGEALPSKLCENFQKLLNCSIYNIYGPTESGEVSFYRLSNTKKNKQWPSISIGKPINNTQFYVLDSNRNLLPFGVPGELYIGGISLALSYYNQPELTRENFLETKAIKCLDLYKIKSKVYKTGDIVRLLPDGNAVFIKRNDRQVKLRGFRVELNEIEMIIKKHNYITNCVVLVEENEDEENRLIAYYVAARNLIIDELCNHCEKYLPQHMIPEIFIAVNEIPLSSSGKIDRKQLNKLTVIPKKSSNKIIPRNRIESILVVIWSKLLKVDITDINNNFFHSGGNSILAVKLISKINLCFNVAYPVSWIFLNPTIMKQAKILNIKPNNYNPIITFNQGFKLPPLFFLHPSAAGAEVYARIALLFSYDQPVYALESYNLYSQKPYLNSLDDIAKYYLSEILNVKSKGPYYLAGWSMGGLLALEIAELLRDKGKEVGAVFLIDTILPNHFKKYDKTNKMQVNRDALINELKSQDPYKGYKDLPKRYFSRIIDLAIHEKKMISCYEVKPYLSKVILFKAILNQINCIDNGWGPYILGDLTTHQISADHMTIMQENNIKLIAETIQNHINRNNIHAN